MDEAGDFTQSARDSWLELRPDEDMTTFDLGMRIRRLGLILNERLTRTVAQYDFLSFGDYEVVASIRRENRAVQPSEIADYLMLTRAGITGRLNRLESQGFVTRTSSELDGRRVLVRVAPLGKRRVDAAFGAMSMERADLFKPLDTREQQKLNEALQRVLAPIDDAC